MPTPDDIAGHFPGLEIQETIGQGGMGVVYRARHKKLDRLVALKILAPELGHDPAFAERFLREARAMARLDHPNIVAVYDFGETGGLCWLMMEHVDGVNLRAALNSGTMTPERALAIVPQLCDALQSAHDLGIVHRDIKPENVLIDLEGHVKIADFGLAKLSGGEVEGLALTQSDVGMGTLHYMAPEQLRGAHTVDHRADIYSLGVVFYEMLTGQLPIGRFELPSAKLKLDVRLDEVVLRALENEPSRRYQQATEVKTDVQAIPHGAQDPSSSSKSAASATGMQDPAPAQQAPAKGYSALKPHTAMICFLTLWAVLLPSLLVVLTGWGTLGLVLLVAQYTIWLYLLTRLTLLVRPDLAAALRRREKMGHGVRMACFAALASLGLTVFGAGVESLWELGTDQYIASTSTSRSLVEPWSEDYGYQLLHCLPEYAPAGAALPELGTPQRNHYFRRTHLPNPAGTFLIAGIALWLAGIALCWRRERTDWSAIGTPLMGTLILAGYAWVMVQMRQSGEPSTLHGVSGSLVLDASISDVRAALVDKLTRRGDEFVVEIGETLVEKRARTPIARHEHIAARPDAALARWRYVRGGPQRIEPGLVIELVGVDGGAKTYASWNAGLLRDGDPADGAWRAKIESLFE